MSTYQGSRVREAPGGLAVTKDGQRLSPARSQKLYNHSPNGFNWGYGGSGPAQMALALLLEETGKEEALASYQAFKWEVVAGLPDDWTLTSEDIQRWLNSKRAAYSGLILYGGTE